MTKILRPRPNWPMSITRHPWDKPYPLGIQHVLAMFAGNITVPLLIALAAGPQYITVLIQIALLAAGVAANPNRWYWADWIPPAGCSRNKFCLCRHLDRCAKGGASLAAVFGASIVGGIFQMILGYFIPQIRKFIPPLVSGIVVMTIGFTLIPVGVESIQRDAVPILQLSARKLDLGMPVTG